MAIKRVSNTAKSRGKAMKKDVSREKGKTSPTPTRSRAQRDDTGEARTQKARAPKTHPTRTPGAVRKDKPGMTRGGSVGR
jgi:hypothetical protein